MVKSRYFWAQWSSPDTALQLASEDCLVDTFQAWFITSSNHAKYHLSTIGCIFHINIANWAHWSSPVSTQNLIQCSNFLGSLLFLINMLTCLGPIGAHQTVYICGTSKTNSSLLTGIPMEFLEYFIKALAIYSYYEMYAGKLLSKMTSVA